MCLPVLNTFASVSKFIFSYIHESVNRSEEELQQILANNPILEDLMREEEAGRELFGTQNTFYSFSTFPNGFQAEEQTSLFWVFYLFSFVKKIFKNRFCYNFDSRKSTQDSSISIEL